jgi:UDP-galactopyranose mutase
MTLYQLWGVTNPIEAAEKLDSVRIKYNHEPQNLEEWILSQVGEEIYSTFIYGYTKKQWNTEPKHLPSFIIKRLPIRLNFNDNYYFDKFQGIPVSGYSAMLTNMVDGIDIILDTDYFKDRNKWDNLAHKIVYTGPIDEFFDHRYGSLLYRSLRFEHETHLINDWQGNAIINYTDYNVPYTRTIEHKHFTFGDQQNFTIVTKEYPENYNGVNEKYYPINDNINNIIYDKYHQLTLDVSKKYIFGGRLAEYKYYDMHQIIGSAHHIYDKYRE